MLRFSSDEDYRAWCAQQGRQTEGTGQPAVSEKNFQSAVVRLARQGGWAIHTTYDSRKSPPGYPDLTLCRPPDLLTVELKVPGGVLTLQQHHWLELLRQVTHVEAHLWTPEHLEEIRQRLAPPEGTP